MRMGPRSVPFKRMGGGSLDGAFSGPWLPELAATKGGAWCCSSLPVIFVPCPCLGRPSAHHGSKGPAHSFSPRPPLLLTPSPASSYSPWHRVHLTRLSCSPFPPSSFPWAQLGSQKVDDLSFDQIGKLLESKGFRRSAAGQQQQEGGAGTPAGGQQEEQSQGRRIPERTPIPSGAEEL